MKIAFLTEMGFIGKIPRNHKNCRTEFAWAIALDATHLSMQLPLPNDKFDIVIWIIPKNISNEMIQRTWITDLRNISNKVVIMQEGPFWGYQDLPLDKQFWYIQQLHDVDMILVHNENNVKYYSGLISDKVHVMPSLMIEDNIKDINTTIKREGTIIGGNFCSWYGGMDSYVIAQEFGEKVFAPSMGRKKPMEDQVDITHLPYMDWTDWIHELNNYKYAVHLMRTHAAGTFALNCAYLGIPCIGYDGIDSQSLCHPLLTVKDGDLFRAKQLAKRLVEDKEFYDDCLNHAKSTYELLFNEKSFKDEIPKMLQRELNL